MQACTTPLCMHSRWGAFGMGLRREMCRGSGYQRCRPVSKGHAEWSLTCGPGTSCCTKGLKILCFFSQPDCSFRRTLNSFKSWKRS